MSSPNSNVSQTNQYIDTIVRLEKDAAIEITEERLEGGEDPRAIVDDLREGALLVGERFERKEYFLADLMRMADILEEIVSIVEPELEGEADVNGSVVLGTVEGDVHDIGKNLVASLLKTNGFEVTDLGVDVPHDEFVEAVESRRPDVVAMSGLLTQAHDGMKETVRALEEGDLRQDTKVIIGGGTIMDESVREYVGADAYATDASKGINQIRKWVEG